MNILFGIELEMFYVDKSDKVTIPESGLPVDGCGAIVEVRSNPHRDIYSATFEIRKLLKEIQDQGHKLLSNVNNCNRYKFTPEEWRAANKKSFKDFSVTPQNLYGKKQRLLPRATVAVALQLNFSNRIQAEYTQDDITYPARYGLMDIPKLVAALDIEFAKEIKESKRVAGEYAIKDDDTRLEYRSLPSTVFFDATLENRIIKVIDSLKGE